MGKGRVEPGRGRRPSLVKQQRAKSLRPFYITLAVVAVLGVALITRSATRAKAGPRATDVNVTAAQAEGYQLGNPKAPVQILQFADFECPACGQFATVTEPDVRKRIVGAGTASYTFFDFPLPQHKNSMAASNAAACAADQGKFWEMHDRLFLGQPEWASEAVSNPRKVFSRYATEIGLNVDAWEACYDERRHESRILANKAEGERRHVQSTPTFVIGRKQIPGSLTYDQIKAYVDSAAVEFATAAAARTDSARGRSAQH
jgi:protein-disulfide isomerase